MTGLNNNENSLTVINSYTIIKKFRLLFDVIRSNQTFFVILAKRITNIYNWLKANHKNNANTGKSNTNESKPFNDLTTYFIKLLLSLKKNQNKSENTNDFMNQIEEILVALFPELIDAIDGSYVKLLVERLIEILTDETTKNRLNTLLSLDDILPFTEDFQKILNTIPTEKVEECLKLLRDPRVILLFLYTQAGYNTKYIATVILGLPPNRALEVINSMSKLIQGGKLKVMPSENHQYRGRNIYTRGALLNHKSLLAVEYGPENKIEYGPENKNKSKNEYSVERSITLKDFSQNTRTTLSSNEEYKTWYLELIILTWIFLLANVMFVLIYALLETEIVFFVKNRLFIIEADIAEDKELKVPVRAVRNMFTSISEFNTHRRIWLFGYKNKGNKAIPRDSVIIIEFVNSHGKVIDRKALFGEDLFRDLIRDLYNLLPKNESVLRDTKIYRFNVKEKKSLRDKTIPKLKDLLFHSEREDTLNKIHIVEMKNGDKTEIFDVTWILRDFFKILGL